ncbi:MAG: aldo/keto reductase [Cytophagales bacterium]|nr:aldo/keto reductase [Bernardetiaceae bacterium]MDW8204277.1 aldo/keto reductase [Cytophagales bacterium]
MQYVRFGNTDLQISRVGFGAWAIGGEAQVGGIPIGWGPTDDSVSIKALHKALDCGITFYDTADFYGLGHSEELIGKTFGNRPDVAIATKVGQRQGDNNTIQIDYTPTYVRKACEQSLRRLRREAIDFYQLHVARVVHLESGELEAILQTLQQEGKIRWYGISLLTFAPEPEAEFCLENRFGHGFQVVYNIFNQLITPYLQLMQQGGYGVIARMPLQFGLLTGKFDANSSFLPTDHRSFRLSKPVLQEAAKLLQPLLEMAQAYGMSLTELAFSFVLSNTAISTVIPGIRTPEQAMRNANIPPALSETDRKWLVQFWQEDCQQLFSLMKQQG